MLKFSLGLLALCAFVVCENVPVDYSGHVVLTITPRSKADVVFVWSLRYRCGVELWNKPKIVGIPIMMRVSKEKVKEMTELLKANDIEFVVSIQDLQSVITMEKIMNAPTNVSHVGAFDFGKYNNHDEITMYLKDISQRFPNTAKLVSIGRTYENRPIYAVKITGGNLGSQPAIMMECGIHSREWTATAACVYIINRLITNYNVDPTVTSLLNKYEFHIVPEANPDGYIYTWTVDRLWRKTRSRSNLDWLGNCRGADPNRNFDVQHCGIGSSRKPCEEIYCGDGPFSESESRAVRDLMTSLGSRLKGYFSVHAFSQLWMTPYGTTKKLPQDYNELVRVAKIGANALAKKYNTRYQIGSIANIIYEAAGSSADYAYLKQNVKYVYALELRDQGRAGFTLPRHLILPACEETYDGIMAAIMAFR